MKRRTTTVHFVTRAGCTICDTAYVRLLAAARAAGVMVATVDVDGDPELQQKYGGRVPVVLGSGGVVLAEGPLTKKDARRTVVKATV